MTALGVTEFAVCLRTGYVAGQPVLSRQLCGAGADEGQLRTADRGRGQLAFEYQQLTPSEWPGLKVVCQLPLPGDDSAQRLAAWHSIA